jgi:hypothetical protein
MRTLFILIVAVICMVGCKKPSEMLDLQAETCIEFIADSLGAISIDTLVNGGYDYSDFIMFDQGILVLSEKGELFYWPYDSQRVSRLKVKRENISAIASGVAQNLYAVAQKKTVYKYDSSGKENRVGTSDSIIHLIRVNSKGDVFAITSYGIYSIRDQVNYFPDSLLNDPFTVDKYWDEPSTAWLDSADNLWIGFDYGEWGGNIISFDTRSRKFNKISVDTAIDYLNPVQSIFPGPDGITYATCGMMHVGLAGGILLIDKNFQCKIIYDKFEMSFGLQDSIDTGEYIGPGAFSHSSGNILYYSDLGFFYAKYENDIFCKSFFYKPKLTWTSGQRLAVGSAMNVRKIHFIDHKKFIFLTRKNGVGYINQNRLTFLK